VLGGRTQATIEPGCNISSTRRITGTSLLSRGICEGQGTTRALSVFMTMMVMVMMMMIKMMMMMISKMTITKMTCW